MGGVLRRKVQHVIITPLLLASERGKRLLEEHVLSPGAPTCEPFREVREQTSTKGPEAPVMSVT